MSLGTQALRDRDAAQVRIEQLEAQVERLQGALLANGVPASLVERITHGKADNWLASVPDTTVDL